MHVEVCFSITLPPYTYCFLFLVRNSKKKKLSVRLYNLCCMCLLNFAVACCCPWTSGVAGAWWVEEVENRRRDIRWLHCTAIRMHYIRHDFFQVQHQSQMCTGGWYRIEEFWRENACWQRKLASASEAFFRAVEWPVYSICCCYAYCTANLGKILKSGKDRLPASELCCLALQSTIDIT